VRGEGENAAAAMASHLDAADKSFASNRALAEVNFQAAVSH